MSGKTISQSETRIESLKLQSSAHGVVIPLVYGLTRISGNLAWYGGFKAVPHTTSEGGKGGGVRIQNTTYSYTASVAMGLCHGTISGLPRIWRGKKLYSGDVTPGQVTSALETYVVPGSGAMTYTVAHAANWLALLDVYIVAYTAPFPWDLVSGGGSGSYDKRYLARGTEYSLAAGVLTILDAALRGQTVTIEYQYTSGAITHTALQQLGLSFLPGNISQAAWSGFASAGAPTAQRLGYSGLAYVAGLDYDLGTGAQVENHLFEVVAPMAYHLGSSVPDVDPARMLRDVLTNARAGAAFPASGLDGWTEWSNACVAQDLLVSPALTEQVRAAEVVAMAARLTNAGPVWSDGKLKMIPFADAAASAHGRSYTPNTTPVYDLDDECWLEAPTVELKSPADRYNHVRIEFYDRANQYNPAIAEAKDQADIDANGLRSMDVVPAHWICDGAVARQVAQILLQRSLYVTATYTARFPWHFALIEPMDLNTLTDPGLGLALLPARVIAIEEDEDGELTITHEDYPAGVCSAAIYQSQVPAGFSHDYNAAPGSVLAPVIFELPGLLTPTGLEIGVAVAGIGANWGGCQVWVSTDGSNYRQIGTLYGPSRYGKLTGPISGGNLPVLLNAGQLTSGSAADATALNTLCYIGGSAPEFCAYQTATLGGPLAYTLSGLVRGAYGSNFASAHATDDVFVRVDDAVARSGALDVGRIGDTVYVKCPSFNIYGAAAQSLADATAYSYVITGVRFGADNGELDLRMDGDGLVRVGNKVTRVSGGGAFDASAYGLEFHYNGAYALAVAVNNTGRVMFGLNSDPLTDRNYTSIDYAAYLYSTGNIYAYRSGTNDGVIGTYVAGDSVVVAYDAGFVRWLKNGVVLHSVAAAANLAFAFDSSFNTNGSALAGIRFGPYGSAGEAGLSGAVVYIYQRATSAPTLPSTSCTYTFATGVVTGMNNGWSATIPAGTNPLYVSVASASASGPTDTIASGEWATPVILTQDGIKAATVYLFKRTATSTPPALPTTSTTYTFATGVATGMNNGWTQSLPTSGGAYRWVTTASALSTGLTDTITSGEWATVAVLAEDGTAGADGTDGADAISASLSASSVSLPADSAGVVTSFAAAVTTMKVMKGATDDTANWTISRTNGSGVSSSLAGATVTVTALANDTGYVDLIATRAGYSTQTLRFNLAKSKSADPGAGVVGNRYIRSDSTPGSAPANAGIKFGTDGTVQAKNTAGTYVAAGNWYSPTTGGIGSSYWIKVVVRSGSSAFSSGTVGSFVALSAVQSWTNSIPSGVSVRSTIADYFIATNSSGSEVVATGVMDVNADTT